MYTPDFSKPVVLSVTQLSNYLKSIIDSDPRLSVVFLTGEISNLRGFTPGKHAYFTLKDSGAVISAVMFAGMTFNLRFTPSDGMKVICRGKIDLYPPHGKYQIIIEDMQPDGVGALSMAYEQLKKELSEKGYFDEAHKKPIPQFPRTVGVITSPTGAAVQDIKNILFRRFPCVDVILCPVQVQGEAAAAQLTEAVRALDESGLCDTIIIGRGGGSIEDLWAFNDRELAVTIYNCQTPVISAVGHETDFTICDFVSDMRAPTPSAAAELAVPDREELTEGYKSMFRLMNQIVGAKSELCAKQLYELTGQLEARSPIDRVNLAQSELDYSELCLKNAMENRLKERESEIKTFASTLESLNPVAILNRGYSVAERDGKVICSKEELEIGDPFKLTFRDGEIEAVRKA